MWWINQKNHIFFFLCIWFLCDSDVFQCSSLNWFVHYSFVVKAKQENIIGFVYSLVLKLTYKYAFASSLLKLSYTLCHTYTRILMVMHSLISLVIISVFSFHNDERGGEKGKIEMWFCIEDWLICKYLWVRETIGFYACGDRRCGLYSTILTCIS